MAGELTKNFIGKEDLKLQTNTNTAETWERLTSVEGTQSITKFPDIWNGTGKINAGVVLGNSKGVLLGDSTANRVIRATRLSISDGTNANTIKCVVASEWNGDEISSTNNIAKNTTTGVFTFGYSGNYLTIGRAGLSGDCVAVLAAVLARNDSGYPHLMIDGYVSGLGDITLYFHYNPNSTTIDMSAVVDTGDPIYIRIAYVTSA